LGTALKANARDNPPANQLASNFTGSKMQNLHRKKAAARGSALIELLDEAANAEKTSLAFLAKNIS